MRRARPRHRAFDLQRALFSFAALLAVFAQTFLVQTHVHFAAGQNAHVIIDAAEAAATPSQAEIGQPTNPADDSDVSCELCQTLAAAGAAIVTAPPILPLLVEASADNTPRAAPSVIVRLARSWQSRAPPFHL